ncbi:ArnT family glycosyltransferase [Hydrogenophaga sp. R2]|uniref:ArnT family glycosyltransferase n=1 Tax=Hydrogenophaga sp. R2 TaxID=3132827 RepID=UPI003CF60825
MPLNDTSLPAARRLFALTFIGTLLLKLLLAATFPMSGDEAFFYQWGVFPAWGYSDHPPMVGWLIALLRLGGDSPLVLRSVTLLVTSLIALGIVDVLRRYLPASRESSAWLAGAVYLVLPWSWMFVLVTTDTPLILFMALSVWTYFRADAATTHSARWYLLCGVLLGLAFLSKYFAALLGFAYAAHAWGWRRERAWAPFVVFAGALPGIALNIGFNAFHGWSNVMFNVFNRNEGSSGSWRTVATYLGMAAYLLTPWLLWQGLRARRADGVSPRVLKVAAVLWMFPLALFLLVSLRRTVGLHWVLGFVPVFVVWAGLRLSAPALKTSWWATLALSVPHLLAVGLIAWAPLSWWTHAPLNRLYDRAVFLRETPAIVAALQADLPAGAALMARTYNPAAMLAYHHRQYVPVFGPGRHHARQDDQIIDFRRYDGQPIRVFLYDEPVRADFEPYFERIGVQRLTVQGVDFWVVDGQGFRFQPFRDQVLAQVARDFHDIPAWLPVRGNPFCERYGFADCAPGRSTGR